VQWATLSWSKKMFAAFCALASLAVVLYGVTAIFNLYVDARVPIALDPTVRR